MLAKFYLHPTITVVASADSIAAMTMHYSDRSTSSIASYCAVVVDTSVATSWTTGYSSQLAAGIASSVPECQATKTDSFVSSVVDLVTGSMMVVMHFTSFAELFILHWQKCLVLQSSATEEPIANLAKSTIIA